MNIVLKTVETCNINCSYCYFFSESGGSFQIKKGIEKIISIDTIKKITCFLKEGFRDLNFDNLNIIFHGGEPLLQKKEDFDIMCSLFLEELSSLTKIGFGIQTNGICISEKWLHLFQKYNISPGVSIDGPKKYHDIHRLNFAGKGTHHQVVKGIKLIQNAITEERIPGMATISVVDPRASAKEVYDHFVKDLSIKSMDFLLPDFNHDTFPTHQTQTGLTIEDYGTFMCDLFDTWINDDNPEIEIRIFKQILLLLAGGKYGCLADTGPVLPEETLPIFTIYHNGKITPDDTFISTRPGMLSDNTNVENITLRDFLRLPVFAEIRKIRTIIPEQCRTCPWVKICNGGASVNRYGKNNDFDNPSVYCNGLKILYSHIATYMVVHGLSLESLQKRLFENNLSLA